MVGISGKQTGRRWQKRKPKTPFDRRLLILEREINKLAREIREYKKQYSDLKPKRGRKPTKKTTNQPIELNLESLQTIEHMGVDVLMDQYNAYIYSKLQARNKVGSK